MTSQLHWQFSQVPEQIQSSTIKNKITKCEVPSKNMGCTKKPFDDFRPKTQKLTLGIVAAYLRGMRPTSLIDKDIPTINKKFKTQNYNINQTHK